MDESIFDLFKSPAAPEPAPAAPIAAPVQPAPAQPAQAKKASRKKRNNLLNSHSAPYNPQTEIDPTTRQEPYEEMAHLSEANKLASAHIASTPAPEPAAEHRQTPAPNTMDPYNVYTDDNPAYHTTVGTLKPPGEIKRNPTTRLRRAYNDAYMAEPQYDEKNVEINADLRSTNSKKYIEEQLYSQVLTKPLFKTPVFLQQTFGFGEDSFSINSLMHLLEIIFAIVIIVLCSNSVSNDHGINHSVWEYLIAASGILCAISFLFLFRIMNFEHNNGIFYCLIASGLSISSMGVAIGILLPTECSSNENTCELRRAETALICVAAILWLINLVQFVTVFYISRLNLTPAVQFPIGYQIPPNSTQATNVVPVNVPTRPPSGPASVAPAKTSFESKRYSDPYTLVPTATTPDRQQFPEPVTEPVEHKYKQQKYILKDTALYPAEDEDIRNKYKVELYA